MVDHEDSDQHEGHVARKIPRTICRRKALQREREQKPPMEELTFGERIEMEINEDREFWIEKVKFHLENLLDKANKDNELQNKMAIHYYTRNQVTKVKIKQLKEKLKETLISQEDKGKFNFIMDSSMIA